jgi:hypothetical protein
MTGQPHDQSAPEPTVIANQAHLPGLPMPGEYTVELDDDGVATVLDGPDKGTTFRPADSVVDAARRADQGGSTINESVETYVETDES